MSRRSHYPCNPTLALGTHYNEIHIKLFSSINDNSLWRPHFYQALDAPETRILNIQRLLLSEKRTPYLNLAAMQLHAAGSDVVV